MSSKGKLNVLIVDDHVMLLEGLQKYIQSRLKNAEITSASDHRGIIKALQERQIDVLLLDVFLEKEDSRSFIKQILNLQNDIKIIMVSSLDDKDAVNAMFFSGIKGFVNKSSPSNLIIEAIDVVMKGETFIDPILLDKEGGQPVEDISSIVLSDKERAVLVETIRGKRIKEIADTLNLSEKSIENYRNNLFIKFNVSNVVGLVREAILLGFLPKEGE